jgi:hypothetical protein
MLNWAILDFLTDYSKNYQILNENSINDINLIIILVIRVGFIYECSNSFE